VDHHRELPEIPLGLLIDEAEAFLGIGAGGRLPDRLDPLDLCDRERGLGCAQDDRGGACSGQLRGGFLVWPGGGNIIPIFSGRFWTIWSAEFTAPRSWRSLRRAQKRTSGESW
jgi:hypothetical protein